MRTWFRRWLALTLLAGCSPTVSGEAPDLARGASDLALPVELPDLAAPTPDLTMQADLAQPRPHAMIAAMPDYVGFVTTLDGSGSRDPLGRMLSHQWKLVQAPAGSALTLPSTNAAQISFKPDRGGEHVFSLTVTTPDGASDVSLATVKVPTVSLFHFQGTLTYATSEVGVGTIRSDGTGARLIGCPVTVDEGRATPSGISSTNPWKMLPELARYGLRMHELPSGAMKVAFTDTLPIEVDGSTSNAWRLQIGDDLSDCNSHRPVRIEDTATFTDRPKLFPRFSPNGRRVAYLDGNRGDVEWRLVTVGVDGSDRHVVRSPNKTTYPTPPAWVHDGAVAWVENLGSYLDPKLIIYTAEDESGAGDSVPAGRKTVVDCYNAAQMKPIVTTINEVVFIPGGMLVSAATNNPALTSDSATASLFHMDDVCTVSRPLALEPNYGQAIDFDVSPDGKTVVMASSHGQVPDGATRAPTRDIFVVPVDRTSPPKKVAGTPDVDDFGPRWVANGRQIVWTQLTVDADSGPGGGGLLICNADGSELRALAPHSNDIMSTMIIVGGGNAGHIGCSWVPSGAPGALALGLVLAAILVAVARSRRRSQK